MTLDRLNRWPSVIGLGVLSGLLLWFSFKPVGVFPLIWVALVPWLIPLVQASRGKAVVVSLIAGILSLHLALFWLRHPTVISFYSGYIASAIGTACLYWLPAVLAIRWVYKRLHLPLTIVVPVLWVGMEQLRTTLWFWKFPWILLGHSQVPWNTVIQFSDVFGAIGVSFLVCGVNGALADLTLEYLKEGAIGKRTKIQLSGALGMVLLALIYGGIRKATIVPVEGPRVLVVQGNIPMYNFFKAIYGEDLNLPGDQPPSKAWYHRNLTIQKKGESIDLICWPETMIDGIVIEGADIDNWRRAFTPAIPKGDRSLALVKTLSAEMNAPLIVGGTHIKSLTPIQQIKNGKPQSFRDYLVHNSALYITKEGLQGVYHKTHLVPISESVPFRGTPLHSLAKKMVPEGFFDFEPGDKPVLFDAGKMKFAPNICFEVSFGFQYREAVNAGADFVTCISNDAWFLDSTEADLALDLAVFRAIETRRAVLRVVNTGISAFVNSFGNLGPVVEDANGTRKQVKGTLLDHVQTSKSGSFYLWWGDGPAWLLVILGMGLIAAPWVRKKSPSEPSVEPNNQAEV